MRTVRYTALARADPARSFVSFPVARLCGLHVSEPRIGRRRPAYGPVLLVLCPMTRQLGHVFNVDAKGYL
jgi:hypothetical protein